MAETKQEKTILNVSVSITDTDVFKHVLAMIGVIYRNTKDEGLKAFIRDELERALKGEWDIEGVLRGFQALDEALETLNRR